MPFNDRTTNGEHFNIGNGGVNTQQEKNLETTESENRTNCGRKPIYQNTIKPRHAFLSRWGCKPACPIYPTGTTGVTGATGAIGTTGATGGTGATGAGSAFIETLKIGDINALIPFNAGGGNNQAIGALAFNGQLTTISRLSTYVTQIGANTGTFQLAVLQPITQTTATVIAVTIVAKSLTGGLFILPLTAPVTLSGNLVYYLAAYNQVNGSTLAGRSTGSGAVGNAFLINFRFQNLPILTVGQLINTSDVSLLLSPYITGLV